MSLLLALTLAGSACAIGTAPPPPEAPRPSLAPVKSIPPAAAPIDSAVKPTDAATKTVFVQNCAPCHGETGDGKGTTKLDKPARSFKDGGFAYGNTPETLLRTITNGIPGTPMPSFASALKEDLRKELAQYVIALGPEQIEVKSSDTILVVRDKPLVVRGKLPPIVDGAPERPRGLLIGTPDGLTFEYRTDDVRLLGVRQGDFVDRKDWGGRGGDALMPLGKVIHVCGRADPGSLFQRRDPATGKAVPMGAKLRGTFVFGGATGDPRGDVDVGYALIHQAGAGGVEVAEVQERPRALVSAAGAGFIRSLSIRNTYARDGRRGSLPIELKLGDGRDGKIVASGRAHVVRVHADGVHEAIWVHGLAENETSVVEGDEARVDVSIFADNVSPPARLLELRTLLLSDWSPDTQALLAKEIAR